jgi:two-component system sensor kinase FixL
MLDHKAGGPHHNPARKRFPPAAGLAIHDLVQVHAWPATAGAVRLHDNHTPPRDSCVRDGRFVSLGQSSSGAGACRLRPPRRLDPGVMSALKPGEEAARWRAIIESAVDGIVVIDSHGILEAFNPAAERLFGYKESEVLGKNVSILMPSPHKEEHNSYIENYLRTGQAKIIGRGREVSARKRDGTLFPIHLAVGEVNIGGERKFTGIIHDLSLRVEMERRLREQTAMARLGEMAAVIAHEVKNPLAGIRGAIQVVGSRLPKEGREAQIMKEVVARIDALNDLMKDLLLFARPPQPKPVAVDLTSLIRSTAELVKADPGHARVDIVVEGETPPVPADAELLNIVFLNLLVNAAHAMNGQGTIRVSLSAEDGTCRVVVADQGPGIPPEIREKIFVPFFTTKARGTGLGLVTARRLVEAHSGTINIDCPEEGGTRVTIEIPFDR